MIHWLIKTIICATLLSGCGARSGVAASDDTSPDAAPGDGTGGAPTFAGAGGTSGAEMGGAFGTPRPSAGEGGAPESVPALSAHCGGPETTVVAIGGRAQMRVDACTWHVADPINPNGDLIFTTTVNLPLTWVGGPDQCASVGGQGWYFVQNMPGIIVMAPAVETFQVCPAVCAQIPAGADTWGLQYRGCR
jgi:hypothetical protein